MGFCIKNKSKKLVLMVFGYGGTAYASQTKEKRFRSVKGSTRVRKAKSGFLGGGIVTCNFSTNAYVLCNILYSSRGHKIQYLISILAIQNIGAAGCYLSAIFAIGSWSDITVMALMDLTKLTLIVGMVVFLATSIRFYILLLKAKYRRGSQKDQLRNKFEKSSYLPLAILGSTVFFIVSQYFVRMLNWTDIQMMITAIMFIGVFYTMIFVLPEQLMILYCKFRFKSFNFDKDGVLYKK